MFYFVIFLLIYLQIISSTSKIQVISKINNFESEKNMRTDSRRLEIHNFNKKIVTLGYFYVSQSSLPRKRILKYVSTGHERHKFLRQWYQNNRSLWRNLEYSCRSFEFHVNIFISLGWIDAWSKKFPEWK